MRCTDRTPPQTIPFANYRYGIVMELITKLVLSFTGFVVAISLIEAVVLSRRKNAATPFAWYEVWISLFDLAARKESVLFGGVRR
jgi:hypothetical protein